jgi:DNA-binding SARP family transcriptional activator
MAAGTAANLKIRLYGPFEAWLGGSPLTGLQNREGERLVALLAISYGRVVPSAALASMLWPDTGSLDSLRQTVVHVRHVLGTEAARLRAPKGGLMLDLTGADVDLVALDRSLDFGDEASLRLGVSLYRGPFLHGWEERYPEDRHWVLREREARKERYRDALKSLARIYLACENHELAATYLQLYVTANPIDEWAWSHWMLALTSAGQRVAAINLYLKCRDYFQHKFSLSPPAEMSRLYRQLRQDQPACDQPDDPHAIEPVGGAVPLQSPYYIARTADRAFQAALARRDSIVLVKGPRQTGKTSLLARGLQQARDSGAQVVFIDFQKLSPDHWLGMAPFYKALAQHIADQLDLELSLEDTWSDRRGVNENFERFLRREVLQKLDVPLVWGLDEVDKLFGYPYANDVFALFRSWHNERSLHPDGPWTKLTLAISYASEAHLFITDLNQSPFNVGTRLTLEDFTLPQVVELNHLYGMPLTSADETKRFYALFGGNPYLVRRGLHALATRESDLAALEAHGQGAEGPFGAHLQRAWLALSQSPELVDAVRSLLRGGPELSPESFFRLRSAGIVVGAEPASASLRCRLYASYLEARLQ